MSKVVLKIPIRTLNRAKQAKLEAAQAVFTECVRFNLDKIKETGVIHTYALCTLTYAETKRLYRLPSATNNQAREKAVQAYKSYVARRKNGLRAKPPTFIRPLPYRLGAANLCVYPDKGMIRIRTHEGYLWLPIEVPQAFREDIHKKHGVSEIVRKGNRWFLMLCITREDVPPSDEGPHFGLDMGLANVAVLAGPGVVKFFDGKPFRYVRGRFSRYRQALMRKRKTGMLRRTKGREANWVADQNHKISRIVVDTVAKAGGILHVEKLTGIMDRVQVSRKERHYLHRWAFAQLLSFIKYKAKIAGVQVIDENPKHTSQLCSRCGHRERGNRYGRDFSCKSCGYTLHADLNAAYNLAAKGACSSGVGVAEAPVPE